MGETTPQGGDFDPARPRINIRGTNCRGGFRHAGQGLPLLHLRRYIKPSNRGAGRAAHRPMAPDVEPLMRIGLCGFNACTVGAEEMMVQLVAHPAPLVEDGVDGVEGTEIGLGEGEDVADGVPVHDDLVVAVRALEDEGIAESSHRSGQLVRGMGLDRHM
jgi:hypothetical protein